MSAPGFGINRSLAREDFPFTIVAYRKDGSWAWAITILAPPGDALVPVCVPPLAKWEDAPIFVTTMTARGFLTMSGPYPDD